MRTGALWGTQVSRFVEAVTERDRKRVRGVERLWVFLQVEQPPHHHLDLALVRLPVADHRLLDLEGRVLGQRYPGFGCCQKDNSARLAENQSAAGVSVVEYLLDHDRGRRVLSKERIQPAVDQPESFRKKLVARRDYTVVDAAEMIALNRNDPVTGLAASRINSDNDHGEMILEKAEG